MVGRFHPTAFTPAKGHCEEKYSRTKSTQERLKFCAKLGWRTPPEINAGEHRNSEK